MEFENLKKRYRRQERTGLLLMMIALPAFGLVYLYHISGNLHWDLIELPGFFSGLLGGATLGLLIGQLLMFRKELKKATNHQDFESKVGGYLQASTKRLWFLFGSSLLSSIGLLLDQGAGYVILFAITLVFFSLAKVTPDRMKRLLKLSKEEGEWVREIARNG